jgi:hypothetical protein
VKQEWIKAIMEVICGTPRHFYMMLTNRPNLIAQKLMPAYRELSTFAGDPLPNLAMGTSIEHEQFLWRGYRLLEQWPGSWFLSLEPLLSRVSIKDLLRADQNGRIRQIIVGGESGRDCRPMLPEWVRQLRDETKEAGRAFFCKLWGDGNWTKQWLKEIGRTLDGVEWNESPWPVPLPSTQTGIRVSPPAIPPKRLRYKGRLRGIMRTIGGINRPNEGLDGHSLRALRKIMWKKFHLISSSVAEGAQVAKVNDGHKLGPDLQATHEEIRHEDCGYRRQRAPRDKAREAPSSAWA